MKASTVQHQQGGKPHVRFTDALGNVTQGELVEVSQDGYAILIRTQIGEMVRHTGGRFDLERVAA